MRNTATKDVIDDMEEILTGLKIARDHWDRGNMDEARRVLDQAGMYLANLINSTKPMR